MSIRIQTHTVTHQFCVHEWDKLRSDQINMGIFTLEIDDDCQWSRIWCTSSQNPDKRARNSDTSQSPPKYSDRYFPSSSLYSGFDFTHAWIVVFVIWLICLPYLKKSTSIHYFALLAVEEPLFSCNCSAISGCLCFASFFFICLHHRHHHHHHNIVHQKNRFRKDFESSLLFEYSFLFHLQPSEYWVRKIRIVVGNYGLILFLTGLPVDRDLHIKNKLLSFFIYYKTIYFNGLNFDVCF